MESTTANYNYSTGTTAEIFTPNHTRRTCPPSKLPAWQKLLWKVDVGVLSTIFVLASIGNLCVLAVVYLRRKKRTRMHLFILHLAIADLVVAVFQVFPELLIRLQCGFHGSDFACRMTKYLQIVGMYGSTFVLVCTAADRYLAVNYPMQTWRSSKNRVYATIAGTWFLSALLSIPQLILFQKHPVKPTCRMVAISMGAVRAYVTWYFLSVFIIPTIILACCYALIAKAVVTNIRSKRQSQFGNRVIEKQGEIQPRANNFKKLSKAKIKTVKMTFVIVITFFVCWAPFFIVQILGIWQVINRDQAASDILHLLASLNSCVNPWIYMGFSGHMLKDLQETVCFWKKKSSNKGGYTRTTTGSGQFSKTNTVFSTVSDSHF